MVYKAWVDRPPDLHRKLVKMRCQNFFFSAPMLLLLLFLTRGQILKALQHSIHLKINTALRGGEQLPISHGHKLLAARSNDCNSTFDIHPFLNVLHGRPWIM